MSTPPMVLSPSTTIPPALSKRGRGVSYSSRRSLSFLGVGKAGEEVMKVDEEAGGSAKMSLDRIEVWLLVEEGRSAGAAARRGIYKKI